MMSNPRTARRRWAKGRRIIGFGSAVSVRLVCSHGESGARQLACNVYELVVTRSKSSPSGGKVRGICDSLVLEMAAGC